LTGRSALPRSAAANWAVPDDAPRGSLMLPKNILAPEGRSEMGQAVMLGTTFAVGMAVFSFAGYWIDQKRGGGLLFTVSGMVCGLAYGAYEVWKVIRMLNEQARKTCAERGQSRTKTEESSVDPSTK
jgi:F0F1-type ATP synthase assembly protein I